MTDKIGWTRRAFLAAKAALTGGLALPASFAGAATTAQAPQGTQSVAPARWPSATAQELQPFVGKRFRVHTQEHGTLVLKLTHVESPPRADTARPSGLLRRAGVIATFEGPDAQLLAASEDAIHKLSHARIGSIHAYLKTMPRRAGGFEMEMVLN